MDIAYKVAEYLADNGFGTLSTDIHVGQIPSERDGLYIIRSGGQPNNYLPIEEVVLDLYYKSTSAATAVQSLEAIKRFIHRMHSTTIDNAHVYTFLVLGDIEDVQRDEMYDKIFKISLQVVHRTTDLIS